MKQEYPPAMSAETGQPVDPKNPFGVYSGKLPGVVQGPGEHNFIIKDNVFDGQYQHNLPSGIFTYTDVSKSHEYPVMLNYEGSCVSFSGQAQSQLNSGVFFILIATVILGIGIEMILNRLDQLLKRLPPPPAE